MKMQKDFLCVIRLVSSAALFFLQNPAIADTRTEELKRCLLDFGGIDWKLPYRPWLDIRACVSPNTNFDSAEKSLDGRRSLELIGELSLGSDNAKLSANEAYAALQSATFAHFEALFVRHGYRRSKLEYGNARVEFYPKTLRMLRGLPPSSEDEIAKPPQPPILFVNLARYVRIVSGKEITLTYQSEMKNTWRITIEGLPILPQQEKFNR